MALLLAWLLASSAEAATCSGPACDEIKMAKGPVTLTLEPADPKKADAGEVRKAATETSGDRGRRCQRALAAEDAWNRLRRQGQYIAAQPEIEGAAAECRRAAAAQSTETEPAGRPPAAFVSPVP